MRVARVLLGTIAFLACPFPLSAAPATPTFQDDFSAEDPARWEASEQAGDWIVEDGRLRRAAGAQDTRRIAKHRPVVDVVVDTQLRLEGEGRQTFGVALRVNGDTYLLLRYYDLPRALEVLSFQQGQWSPLGERSEAIEVQKAASYRMKAVAIGDTLLGKLWQADQAEPDWQLDVKVANLAAGQVAVVAHDNTDVQFDWFHAWSGNDALEIGGAALEAIDIRHRGEQAELLSKMRLVATPAHGPYLRNGETVRRVNLVTTVDADRRPIGGQLKVDYGGERLLREVAASDFIDGGYVFELPEPAAPLPVNVVYQTERIELRAEFVVEPPPKILWRQYVQTCLDTLLEHGRDDYGAVKSPLFMAVLDADTLRSPAHPYPTDALVRLEGRMHRRGERGCNLWYDQSLLQALYRMSKLTGDRKYASAGDDYIRYFLTHCNKLVDPRHTYLNGMPSWGTHVYWDCYEDLPAGDGDGNGPHEILVFRADWAAMYRVAPQRVRRAIDGIWLHHVVDKESGLHNRHDDQRQGCDFAFSGSSFTHALAFMHQATGDGQTSLKDTCHSSLVGRFANVWRHRFLI